MEEISAQAVLRQLYCIATADATKLMQVKDGALEISSTGQLDDALKAAVASIEKGSGGIKVKLYDKLKALELLGKYLGLFDGGGKDSKEENPLLQALVRSLQEEQHGNIFEQAADCHDLVGAEEI